MEVLWLKKGASDGSYNFLVLENVLLALAKSSRSLSVTLGASLNMEVNGANIAKLVFFHLCRGFSSLSYEDIAVHNSHHPIAIVATEIIQKAGEKINVCGSQIGIFEPRLVLRQNWYSGTKVYNNVPL